jgi:Family of unknown function (DUF6504)
MSSSNNDPQAEKPAERPAARLISEPIQPQKGSFDASAMASGQPGAPRAFTWRGKEYRVARELGTNKSFRGCRNGSGERYVDKHYVTVETETGEEMTLYRTRSGSKADSWILYTIKEKA